MIFQQNLTNSSLRFLTFHLTRRYISTPAKPQRDYYDIIISGGGMVGFALAAALGKNEWLANKSILLLEGQKKKQFNLSLTYSNRVCALNQNSKRLLTDLGSWNLIEKSRFSLVKKMQVWDACSDATITFGKPDLSEDIAYIVENDVILNSLVETVELHDPRVEVAYDCRVSSYELPATQAVESKNMAKVKVNNREIGTSLLVGADGFNSALRQAMKVQYLDFDYGQMAVVATLRIAEGFDNVTAWQRFLPSGPVALLPLASDLSSLVWSTDKDSAKKLLQLSPEDFVNELNTALWSERDKNPVAENASGQFGQILKALNLDGSDQGVRQLPPSVVSVEGQRGVFPLGFGHAVNYVSNRSAIIGDAAHRVHPLAGQGVNLGFGDVAQLSETLAKAVQNGGDIGDIDYLREYESAQQRKNLPIMAGVHGLHFLYTSKSLPVVLTRSLGLQFVNALNPLKDFFAKRAAS